MAGFSPGTSNATTALSRTMKRQNLSMESFNLTFEFLLCFSFASQCSSGQYNKYPPRTQIPLPIPCAPVKTLKNDRFLANFNLVNTINTKLFTMQNSTVTFFF